MPKQIIHTADSRGHANHGWLDTYYSFSFSSYYNPERINFGALRVINDDTIAPAMGFGKHPHDNMEIITIMLEGDLQHRDSMGHTEVIGEGEIQVMSAGSGIYHSEANHRRDKTAKLLQIWVFPNKKNVEPRYDQFKMDKAAMHNCLQQIISPSPDDDGSWLHQDAWFVMGQLDAGFETTYQVHLPVNGVYAYIIEGSATINGTTLNRRDAMGIWDTDSITIKSHTDTHLLLIEVPMVF